MWHQSFIVNSSRQTSWQTHKHTGWKHYHLDMVGDNKHTTMCQYTAQSNWGWLNMNMPFYQFRKAHCREKMISCLSYFHNGISNTCNTSLQWIKALICQYGSCSRLISTHHSMVKGTCLWNLIPVYITLRFMQVEVGSDYYCPIEFNRQRFKFKIRLFILILVSASMRIGRN